MCFSPGADAVVGGAVVLVGIDALRHVRQPRQIPLASLPLLFGLHQIDEAFVWLGLQGHVSGAVEHAGLWVYLFFALAALPALVPAAVYAVEPTAERRRVIAAFGALAAAIGLSFGVAMFRGTIGAAIEGHHIAYDVSALQNGGQLTALYVVATCGALIACSYRDVAVVGVVNLIAVPVLVWMTVSGFISVWCFWAAIVSVMIDAFLRRSARQPATRIARAVDASHVT